MEHWFDCDVEVHQIRSDGNATLARGAFGEVRLAIDRKHEVLVVLKSIAQATVGGFGDSKRQLCQQVANEIAALRLLNNHANIVPFLGLALTSDNNMPSNLSLVFEYCPIDLHTVISRRRVSLSFQTITFITKEVLSALCHCHSSGIIHRDVTPRNLLISTHGRIQLCDFGLAKPSRHLLGRQAFNETSELDDSKAVCALYYRSPESLLGGPAVHASLDMYSCGLVIAELVTGRPLFSGKNVLDQLHRTFQILGTPHSTEPWVQTLPDFSRVSFRHYDPQPLEQILPRAAEHPALLSLLQSLVVLDPQRRSSAQVALHHDCCQSIPRGLSAVDLIPTECKGVLFSQSSIDIMEDEALSLATARRFCKNHEYSDDDPIRFIEAAMGRL